MNKLEFNRFEELDYNCAEALNMLCANLSFAGSDMTKIMITSCKASEGKSFLVMNMMRTLAGLGKNVVMVDADLRRSAISSKYGVRIISGSGRGLAHFLAGMSDIHDVLYSTNIKNAFLVPVGHEVSNSLSLLSTSRFTDLLDRLAENFDLVLIDAPPVGLIIDAAEIAKSCDGALLAVSYNEISGRELNENKIQIERAGCTVLGAVLNNVKFDTISSKKHYYRNHYSGYAPGGGHPVDKPKTRQATSAKRPQKRAK